MTVVFHRSSLDVLCRWHSDAARLPGAFLRSSLQLKSPWRKAYPFRMKCLTHSVVCSGLALTELWPRGRFQDGIRSEEGLVAWCLCRQWQSFQFLSNIFNMKYTFSDRVPTFFIRKPYSRKGVFFKNKCFNVQCESGTEGSESAIAGCVLGGLGKRAHCSVPVHAATEKTLEELMMLSVL